MFQHAAARRRLGIFLDNQERKKYVSTRSRPKAAGLFTFLIHADITCFNTQPPEGGWVRDLVGAHYHIQFQHAAARRRLEISSGMMISLALFQHAAARRRLANASAVNGWLPLFQHAAARRRLDRTCSADPMMAFVSTRSRPKAAGRSSRSV